MYMRDRLDLGVSTISSLVKAPSGKFQFSFLSEVFFCIPEPEHTDGHTEVVTMRIIYFKASKRN